MQYHLVLKMHESTVVGYSVSFGFLSIRLSTDEVDRWSESFDHLLSHKCKWKCSFFSWGTFPTVTYSQHQENESHLNIAVKLSFPVSLIVSIFRSAQAKSIFPPPSLSYVRVSFLCCEDSLPHNESHTCL